MILSTTFVLFAAGASVASFAGPALDDSSYVKWREYLAPTDEEMCWRTIPWRETFQQGVRDAQIEGKPILLWAMNGHPLGCV
jgi:hypothetical protein